MKTIEMVSILKVAAVLPRVGAAAVSGVRRIVPGAGQGIRLGKLLMRRPDLVQKFPQFGTKLPFDKEPGLLNAILHPQHLRTRNTAFLINSQRNAIAKALRHMRANRAQYMI